MNVALIMGKDRPSQDSGQRDLASRVGGSLHSRLGKQSGYYFSIIVTELSFIPSTSLNSRPVLISTLLHFSHLYAQHDTAHTLFTHITVY